MKSTRSITHGAMTLGLIVIIMYLDRMSSQLFSFLLGLPLLIYAMEFGIRDGFVVYITSIILTFILGSLPTAILMSGYGATAISLCYGINHFNKQWKIYLLSFIVALPLYIIMLSLFSEFFGYDMHEFTSYVGTWGAYLIIILLILAEIYIQKTCYHLFYHYTKHRK